MYILGFPVMPNVHPSEGNWGWNLPPISNVRSGMFEKSFFNPIVRCPCIYPVSGVSADAEHASSRGELGLELARSPSNVVCFEKSFF